MKHLEDGCYYWVAERRSDDIEPQYEPGLFRADAQGFEVIGAERVIRVTQCYRVGSKLYPPLLAEPLHVGVKPA